jgi:predicted phage terminase large subunit-like protein
MEFLTFFWDTIVSEKFSYNWHIEFLCEEMQAVANLVFANEPKEYDLLINVPPGTTKSTICSVAFPIWTWTRMPSAKSVCGSYAHSLALDLSRRSRMIVLSEKFQKHYPQIKLCDDQNTKGHFANTQGGARFTTSVGGSVTGMHGHFLIADDPVDPMQADSEADLETANKWMGSTLPTRKVDKEVSASILIQQRLHQNDPSATWIKNGSNAESTPIRHICLPAILTEDVSPPELANNYRSNPDNLLDPKRMSLSVLNDMRKKLGELNFSGQFQQRPTPPGGAMFLIDQFRVEPVSPKMSRIVRYWDKAGSETKKACYTAGVKMGLDMEGRFWILDVVRGRWEASTREKIIKSTAESDGKGVSVYVEQEPGSSGKESAQSTVRNLAGYCIYADLPTGDKAVRARPFAVQVNGGNVLLLKSEEWNGDFVEELRYFPHSTYKDQVDACSGGFAKLTTKRKVGALV